MQMKQSCPNFSILPQLLSYNFIYTHIHLLFLLIVEWLPSSATELGGNSLLSANSRKKYHLSVYTYKTYPHDNIRLVPVSVRKHC